MSAAVNAKKQNINCELYESSKNAGGRCRSFYDKKIGLEIDNGNHLVFSANNNFFNFCKIVGSQKTLKTLPSCLNFYDVKKKKKWELSFEKKIKEILNNYPIPNTNFFDYLSILKFIFVKRKSTVFQLVGNSNIYREFWEPLTLAVMNTSPKLASAQILSNVLKVTFFKGKKHCLIYQPEENWGKTLIDPAISFIQKKINFNESLKKISFKDGKISELIFTKRVIKIKNSDRVVFAIPPTNLNKLFPEFKLPTNYNTILNVHFKINRNDIYLFDKKIIGFINTKSHWMFVKNQYISITISDANNFNSMDSSEIANIIWQEMCEYVKKKITYESFQIVREKKATYIQTPKNIEMIINFKKKTLPFSFAGDWTQSNLPCTIEASILSGKKAIDSLV